MNLETIERIVALLEEYPVREIELSTADSRIAVKRGTQAHQSLVSLIAPPHAEEPHGEQGAAEFVTPENAGTVVVAEIVGIFHHMRPPIIAGTSVNEGQAVGQIESMKLLHEVSAPVAGVVAEVLLDDGHAVEYGSALFRIIPA